MLNIVNEIDFKVWVKLNVERTITARENKVKTSGKRTKPNGTREKKNENEQKQKQTHNLFVIK